MRKAVVNTERAWDARKDTPPFLLPQQRICHWCKEPKNRAHGRWVTKTVWLCKPCVAELEVVQ